MSVQQQNDVMPVAGVTAEPSIPPGSALPAGLSAILRGDMAKVVFADTSSPGCEGKSKATSVSFL